MRLLLLPGSSHRRFQESSVSRILPIRKLLADQGIYVFLVVPKFRRHLMQDLLWTNTAEQHVHNIIEDASLVLLLAGYHPSPRILLDKHCPGFHVDPTRLL